ncbi:hypothetical protein [Knoellia aerolata]|uniref:hypothetical protein n=1 Tax=Knoellia aerolata TaxID=442954 RepID=UPI0014703E73|nr:hypothetical protein [Knoellia aerolata]
MVAGHRAYAAAERYLTTSDENHDALASLLAHHGASATAPWNLLRPSFEAAFYALWLLSPSDSQQRRQRGVRLEWLDDIETEKFHRVALGNREVLQQLGLGDAAAKIPPYRENTDTYVREANATGLAFQTTRHRRQVNHRPARVNVENELGGLFPEEGLMSLAHTTTWKTLSGIQHAEAGALLRVTDRSSLGGYPGGQRLHLTINDGAFYLACLVTASMRAFAWSRFGECHRPARSNEPVDLRAMRDMFTRYPAASSQDH